MSKKPFVILDAEILSSSVWSEAAHVRLVWITLLILCDTDGYVGASVPGIASAAGVTLAQCEDALAKFQAPDPYSRTTANEGRRLELAERGWRVLNFMAHIDRLSSERRKARERVKRHRARKEARIRDAKAKKSPKTPEPQPETERETPCNAPDGYSNVTVPPENSEEESSKQGVVEQGRVPFTDNNNGLSGQSFVGEQEGPGKILSITSSAHRLTASEKGAITLVEVWNALFGTHFQKDGAAFHGLVEDFSTRCSGGRARGVSWAPVQVADVISAAFIADATGREFWRKQPPAVILRTGAFGKMSGTGATTGGTDHVRELLTKPQMATVRLSGSARQLARMTGMEPYLAERGVSMEGS